MIIGCAVTGLPAGRFPTNESFGSMSTSVQDGWRSPRSVYLSQGRALG